MQEDDPVAGEDPVAGTFKERVLADSVYFFANMFLLSGCR
jgi:hypothetical protein